MATSGSTDFTLTRDDIIAEALELIGVVPVNTTPDSDKVTSASKSLNLIIKNIQADGTLLWSIEADTKTFTTAVNYFTVDTDTIDIQSPFVRDGNIDYPLKVITYDEYMSISDKSDASGTPEYLVFDRQLLPVVRMYPTIEDVTQVIHYLRVRKLADYDAANNTSDAPVSWERVIVWLLAAELCPKYGIDLQRTAYIEKKANELYKMVKRNNSEQVSDDFIHSAY